MMTRAQNQKIVLGAEYPSSFLSKAGIYDTGHVLTCPISIKSPVRNVGGDEYYALTDVPSILIPENVDHLSLRERCPIFYMEGKITEPLSVYRKECDFFLVKKDDGTRTVNFSYHWPNTVLVDECVRRQCAIEALGHDMTIMQLPQGMKDAEILKCRGEMGNVKILTYDKHFRNVDFAIVCRREEASKNVFKKIINTPGKKQKTSK